MLRKIKITKLFLPIFLLSLSTLFAIFSTHVVFADPSSGVSTQATRYCNSIGQTDPNAGNTRNCRAAYTCAYVNYKKVESKCKNNTSYNYDNHNINLKAHANESWIKKAFSAGAEEASPNSGDSSSSGGSGSSSGGSTTTGSSDLGGSNDQIKDQKTEDGIDVNGAKVNAAAIDLNSSDASKAGLDNNQPGNVVAGILNVAYALSASIAVIVIIAAGIMYITSDGDPARISRAKNAIIYSAVGLVIIGSAFLLTGLIQGIAAG